LNDSYLLLTVTFHAMTLVLFADHKRILLNDSRFFFIHYLFDSTSELNIYFDLTIFH